MRKFLLLFVILVPVAVFPQLEPGMRTFSISGNIYVYPSFSFSLYGGVGSMFTENLEIGVIANVSYYSSFYLSGGGFANYYYPLGEGIYGFAGFNGSIDLIPGISFTPYVNAGIVYFIVNNVAVKVYNSLTFYLSQREVYDAIKCGMAFYF